MFLPRSFLLRLVLENTIAPPPITVTPDVLVTEAIALLNSSSGNFDPGMGANDCTGCLAVVSENQLMGLFSERVVTRLVASGRSLAGVTLAEVIEPPAIALRQSELTNPDVALSLLQKHQIQHLPILDDNGQLLGLLTYESLCRLLQLVEPDRPDEASIAALKLQTERSQLLMAVSTRIRASLSLAEILNATVSEVRQFLGCDRVSIYHFLENGQFQVVAESLAAGQRSFVSEEIYDPCFAPDWTERYGQGRVRVVSDIYTAGMTPCHVELLEHLQIRAKILVPAIVNNQFWGLVSASESAVPRDWQPAEVTFLEQLGIQVAIAIQHSETAARFQQQGQELTALLDRSPDVIFRLNRDLHYLYLNAAVEVELGYAPEALIGQPLLAATLAPEHLAEWQTLTQQVAATRQEQTIEYQLRLQSRSIWFQTRVVPEYNMDGTVTSFLCVARNITQKKQAEARQAAYINVLLEWQNRHHAAQLATKQVLYEWDTSSNRMMWGINAEQVFGYNASEMPQTSADWFASIHPEDEKRVQTAVAEYFEHQGHLYLQYRWQHQAGHYIWIETQAQFFADANGNLTQIIGYVTDINEKKRLEAERTQLETALRESEAQLRQIFDNSQDVFFLKSLDSKQMIYTSPAWEYLYQTPLQQTYDNPQSWLDFIHPDDRDGVVTFNQQACQGKEVCSFAYRIIRPDNSIRWLWNRSFPIRNEAGEIYRLAGANIDITEQKKLELELSVVKERYQLAIRGIGEGVWDWDLVSDRVIASDRYWEILGYPSPAKNAWKFADEMLREEIHPDDLDLMQLTLKGHLEDHLPYEVEFRRRKQSGEYIWCRSRGEAIRDQTGKPIRMVGAIADITEPKAMATALQASEETLRQVVNTVPGVVYTYCCCVDGTKSFRFISQGIIKLCDRTPEEILNDSQVLWHLIVPEDAERMRDLIDQSAAMLTPWTAEFRLITASKVLKWVFGHSIPSRQADGSIIWHGILIDISDRKHAEAKLRQQEEFLRSIYTGAELAIFVIEVSIDQEFRFLEFNPVAERYGSVTCEEIQGKTPEEAFGEAVGSAIRQKYVLCLKSGQKISYEEYISFPGGSIWALTNLFPIRSEAGNIHRIIGTAININDRKQAELERQRSEALLQALIAASPVGLTLFDRELRYLYGNEALAKINDLPLSKHLGRTLWEVFPEMASQFAPMLLQVIETQVPIINMEFSGEVRPGVFRSAISNHYPVCLPNGEVIGVGVSVMDVTELVQAQQKLRESEAWFRTLADNISQFAWITDEHGSIEWYNQRWFDYTGTTLAEMQGWGWQQVHHPDRVDGVVKKISHCFETGEIWEDTFPLRGRDGQYRWFLSRAIPIRDEQGRVLRWFGTNTDITEQKQTEVALQTSEQILRQLTNMVPGAVYKYQRLPDGSNNLIFMSEGIVDLYEYTPEELLKDVQIVWDIIFPEDIEKIGASIDRSAATLEAWEMEFRIRTPSGILKWISGHSIPTQEEDGSIIWFGILTDISDRKQAELALQASKQRYLNLAELSPVGIFHTDPSGDYKYVNSRWCQLAGLSFKEAMDMGWKRALHPEDRDWVFLNWQRATQSQIPFLMECRFQRPDGKVHWLICLAIAETDKAGKITGYIGTITDITERKFSEQALQESEQRYRDLAEAMPQMVWLSDVTGAVYYLNRRWYDYTGQSEAEAMGFGAAAVVHPDERDRTLQEWAQAIATGSLFESEYRVRDRQGLYHWFLARGIPIQNQSREITGWVGTVTDIDDFKRAQLARKQAELALQASEARLNDVLNSAGASIGHFRYYPNGFWETDYHSKGCERVFGYRPEEFLAEVWLSNIVPEDWAVIQERMQAAIKAERETTLEYRFYHPDGSTRWVLDTLTSHWNESNRCWVVTAIGTDDSDRKHAELALQQLNQELEARIARRTAALSDSELRYRSLFEQAAVGISQCHSSGHYIQVNQRFCELTGYTKSELLDMCWEELIYPEDLQLIRGEVADLHRGELASIATEIRYVRKDRQLQWVGLTVSLLYDTVGRIISDLAVVEDINDRKQAEMALQASELSYRTLAENLPGIVYKLYPAENNTFVFFNDHLTALFHLDPLDLANQGTLCPVNSLIVPEDRDRVIEVIQGAIANQQPFQVEYCIYIPATQEKRYLLEQGSTVTDDIGQALHIVGIIFDVTQIKQTEEKLRKINEQLTIANAELARATRLKDEFLANMSHELRTPLNSILGLSEVLQERTYGNLTEQQHHTLTTIQTNGEHLLELINDILDLAKIESGKLNLQITPVSVEQLCRSTIPFIQQQAFKKQISFTLELSPNLPDIELDERLIRQVLINLLTNAIKFTPNGGAVILKVQGNAAEQTMSFSAIDTGIGIAPENIDKLFQPFVQIDSSLSRRYAGTGLGLALVRRIIELHKGSVKVRSTVGQGSEFIVMLPWKQVNQPNSDKPVHRTTAIAEIASPFLAVETKNTAENVVKKPVVLLVDDNLDNIETLQAYLELKGFNIVVARNGLQAIHLTQMQSFNLILMDIQMPDMNGLEAIRQIRSQEQYKHTPILAVTALAMSGDKEKCLAVGANDYLTKPISPIHLVNTMKKYLQLCQLNMSGSDIMSG
ncbi:MAG: PAS domain S-box protein [Nostoc sp. DedQUE04]|uniref:PAS domain S-box protein n=1 Tax=Nostoc sp. DedQUE04 TaxID=3075390 RepID=UPI002AD28B60|nr:PAS domain S-box protein [Nostoc sp. DedQUE04]MDZ8136154.1 PAS domain S-box protein [Nostoc sp. DedQUE04]